MNDHGAFCLQMPIYLIQRNTKLLETSIAVNEFARTASATDISNLADSLVAAHTANKTKFMVIPALRKLFNLVLKCYVMLSISSEQITVHRRLKQPRTNRVYCPTSIEEFPRHRRPLVCIA